MPCSGTQVFSAYVTDAKELEGTIQRLKADAISWLEANGLEALNSPCCHVRTVGSSEAAQYGMGRGLWVIIPVHYLLNTPPGQFARLWTRLANLPVRPVDVREACEMLLELARQKEKKIKKSGFTIVQRKLTGVTVRRNKIICLTLRVLFEKQEQKS